MRIGFIGFGEAASTIAGGLRSAGVEGLFAFDINAHDAWFGPLVQRRAVEGGNDARRFVASARAMRYDADEYVFQSLNESFPGLDWTALANYMVGRVVVHGEPPRGLIATGKNV